MSCVRKRGKSWNAQVIEQVCRIWFQHKRLDTTKMKKLILKILFKII